MDELGWVNSVERSVEPGDRIKLVSMLDDPLPIKPGTEGTVTKVQDVIGVISVDWDNGRSLNIIKGVDSFTILEDEPNQEPTVESVDLIKKYNISDKQLQVEVENGINSELNFTKDTMVARFIVMENLNNDLNYYNKENITENFFGSMGNAFGKKQNRDDQYDMDEMVSHIEKIKKTIDSSDYYQKETIQNMIENFREKYSNHTRIKDMMKSLYYELDNMGGDIDETTSAGSAGAFSGPLFGGRKNESRIIKFKDLLESTHTKNSGKYDKESKSPFDSNKDGWYWNDKSWYSGGEIVDDVAQLDTNWKDELLSVKMTKESLIKSINYLNENEEEDLDETTTASASGQYVGPMFAAKNDKDHKPSKKPIWKGGKIVQKIKNSGILAEINKVKYHKDADYVTLKSDCVKYNNKPWCSQGDIDKPLKLSKTTKDNISEVSKKTGISEEEIKKIVIKRLSK